VPLYLIIDRTSDSCGLFYLFSQESEVLSIIRYRGTSKIAVFL
jgi:hypothetical protein